jgi:hypothetical protein
MTAKTSENRSYFQNGWYCPKCDRLTEHTEKLGRQVCNICGFALGRPIEPKAQEFKLKAKIYRLTRQIERQKKDSVKKLWIARVEKILAETKEELAKDDWQNSAFF